MKKTRVKNMFCNQIVGFELYCFQIFFFVQLAKRFNLNDSTRVWGNFKSPSILCFLEVGGTDTKGQKT